MVSVFTPNIQLEEPARGDDVGTWDTPVNSNMTLVDKVVGAIATISLNNSPVVLASAQFQSKTITFNSTLTGNVAITFPTSFTKSYEIQNLCSGSSSFLITLQTTAAGGQIVCCPPGEIVDVLNDGTNIKFKNMGRIGEYWDYAAATVPGWVTGCTVPPYLNCNATVFSSITYPVLAMILNSVTTPDMRNRARVSITGGRLTSAISGVDGATIFATGGNEAQQQHNHGTAISDPGHTHVATIPIQGFPPGGSVNDLAAMRASNNTASTSFNVTTASATTGIGVSVTNTGAGASQNVQPTIVHGITMIRAA